jgi:steroid delta-isomerase-like uncharacterized protein
MAGDEGKDLVRRAFAPLSDVMKTHDELYGPEWVGHFPGMPPLGPESHRMYSESMAAAFPDLERRVDDIVAEGDRVVARWSAKGTQTGPFMGAPPSGKVATSSGITIFRIADGRIVEEWAESDMLGLLQQVGALAAPKPGDHEHPNVQRFKRAIEARTHAVLSQDDRAALDDLFGDGVVWHAGPTGDVIGRGAVIELWNGWARGEQGGLAIDVRRVYADGLHGFTEVEVSTGSGDRRLTVMQGTAYELDEAGVVTGFWGMPSDGDIAASFAAGKVPDVHRNMAFFEEAEAVRNRQTFTDYDIEVLHRFLDEHVIWHGAGRSAFKDGARERENVITLYKMFKEITGGTFAMTYSGFYVGDNHAASFVKLTGEVGPKHMDFNELNLFHVAPDGHTFEFWGIAEDQEEIDAFWDPAAQ